MAAKIWSIELTTMFGNSSAGNHGYQWMLESYEPDRKWRLKESDLPMNGVPGEGQPYFDDEVVAEQISEGFRKRRPTL
jgi:hypothetical protein